MWRRAGASTPDCPPGTQHTQCRVGVAVGRRYFVRTWRVLAGLACPAFRLEPDPLPRRYVLHRTWQPGSSESDAHPYLPTRHSESSGPAAYRVRTRHPGTVPSLIARSASGLPPDRLFGFSATDGSETRQTDTGCSAPRVLVGGSLTAEDANGILALHRRRTSFRGTRRSRPRAAPPPGLIRGKKERL